MTSVTAAKFTKNFGLYRTEAHKRPVFVTNYGKEDLVVLDAAEYKRLKARDQEAMFAWDLKPSVIEALQKDDIAESSKAFDHEME